MSRLNKSLVKADVILDAVFAGDKRHLLLQGKGWVRNADGTCLCLVCGKFYHNHGNVYRHVKEHHIDEGKTWTCSKCGSVYKKKRSLQEHYERAHQIKVPSANVISDQDFETIRKQNNLT